MSESSYQKNVSRGVTGAYFPTCFPSALERISPVHKLPPELYETYASFMNWYDEEVPQLKRLLNPCYKEVINQLAWELGKLSCDDIEFYSVDTYDEFEYTVRQLLKRDCRVAVDIDETYGWNDGSAHTLGLLPTENRNYFRLVSNHTPKLLCGLVKLEQIFDELSFPDENPTARYQFQGANITALPVDN